jgi:polyphenol oxidase
LKTNKLGAEALRIERGGVVTVQFPRLADPKVLNHAVSTRIGGVSRGTQNSLNISFKVGDEPIKVEENRGLLSGALGMDLRRVIQLTQIHSDKVFKLDAANHPKPGKSLGEGDGLITNEPNSPLMVLVADCLPILFYDPLHKAIGLAHAGWRGTATHVAPKTLLAMEEAYGSKPGEVKVVLGPCIGPCCYEVGEDVKKEFENVFPWAGEVIGKSAKHHWKLDLAEANARQLLEVGVQNDNLIRSGLCTVENLGLFYSHRAEASAEKPTGRVGAFMMLHD